MGYFILKPEITVGEILTAISIMVSVATLFYAWRKDRQSRTQAEADRIRRAAGTIIAKLERRSELALRFFDDIQPLITDADTKITQGRDIVGTRDFFWRELDSWHAKAYQKIIDEQIEIAYIDLYGYDPKIQELFASAIRLLKIIDVNMYHQVRQRTQWDILRMRFTGVSITNSQLGNTLRSTCFDLASEYKILIDEIVVPFRSAILGLIYANDKTIVNKKALMPESVDIFPGEDEFFRRTINMNNLFDNEVRLSDDVEVIRCIDIYSACFVVGIESRSNILIYNISRYIGMSNIRDETQEQHDNESYGSDRICRIRPPPT